ncbi:hypothetical protein BY996DRAFT_4603314 [Phakopsora pachyrhizi]|uniref:Uncharacterized protein n=1 Tax=Phakopsora pachyrhizi TaxID=170000 RepID=A0AAV0AU76_PHAPC|nr:hypothetical protein BY996DRAFT_4603314 [Phakopsora pachyrhizi]CAH7672362.1 hypothetical protein PPACK8108_LOCUS7164 [Phakopsora pachyrhizi]
MIEEGRKGSETDKSLESRISRADSLRGLANEDFKRFRWQAALNRYSEALLILPPINPLRRTEEREEEDFDFEEQSKDKNSAGSIGTSDRRNNRGGEKDKEGENGRGEDASSQDPKLKTLRSVLNSNSAACYLKLKDWKSAVEACNLSIKDDPQYVKALHRRAQANENLSTWASLQASLDDYNALSKLPNLPAHLIKEVKSAQNRLPSQIAQRSETEKAEMMSKLKDLGNNVLGKFGMSVDNFKFTPNETGGYSMSFQK